MRHVHVHPGKKTDDPKLAEVVTQAMKKQVNVSTAELVGPKKNPGWGIHKQKEPNAKFHSVVKKNKSRVDEETGLVAETARYVK